jgi:hypothetical protein
MVNLNGLRLLAYAGDGNILLAWDLDPEQTVNLAGLLSNVILATRLPTLFQTD